MQTLSRRIWKSSRPKLKNSRKKNLMSTIVFPDKCLKWNKSKTNKGKNWMRYRSNMKIKKLISRKSLISKIRSAINFKPKLSPYSNNKITAWTKWANLTEKDSKSMRGSMKWTWKLRKFKRETKMKNKITKKRRTNSIRPKWKRTNWKTENNK